MESVKSKSYVNHIFYIDMLRVLAIIAVLLMHTAGHRSPNEVSTIEWQICNIFDSGTRWAVPIFVMISGCLFLDKNKEISIKKLYRKNILRIITAYIFWSLIYTLVFSTIKYYKLLSMEGIINTIAGTLKGGMYHFWYIFLIIGLYISIPIFKRVINVISEKELKYWMILLFVFSFVVPVLRILNIFNNLFGTNINYINMGILGGGYVFYFLLGHYLASTSFSKKMLACIYILGALSFLSTIVLTGMISWIQGEEYTFFRDNLTPNVMFMSIAIFVFCKTHSTGFAVYPKIANIIAKIASLTFGIYLVHEMILSNIDMIRISLISPLADICVIFTATFVLSSLIIYFISKIKRINKYLI